MSRANRFPPLAPQEPDPIDSWPAAVVIVLAAALVSLGFVLGRLL